MPGLFRPYTLQDVLNQLNEQSTAAQGSTVPLQGFFNATDEAATVTDTVTGTAAANPTWDNGHWGLFTWS